ncbi:MAG: discoidin domain-containing protein [Akkermansia sp.]
MSDVRPRHFPGVARVTAEFNELNFPCPDGPFSATASSMPPYLSFRQGRGTARLGFTFGMPAAYDQVEYLDWGRTITGTAAPAAGKTCSDRGRHVLCLFPPAGHGQPHGPDWVAPRKSAPALWVGAASPGAPLEVSILRYTPRELNNAKSLDKLPEKNKVIVNLDAFQMGLGGSSCGPRPLVKYQTLSEATPLGFVLAPASGLLNLARSGLLVPHSPVIERDGDGMVSLSSSTPGVEMKYSVNKGPEKVYKKPFKLPEGNVRAWAAAGKPGSAAPTSPDERQFPLIKGQAEWKILSASSEEPDTGFAHFAIDGKPDTYWHTSYTNGLPGFPHSIAVDMGTRMKFTGFIYTPRMDKDKGLISQYAFSISDDGKNWKEVKKGQFTYHYIRKDPAVQRIDFGKPVEARYFKLDAKSPVRSGEQSATVAELNIITQ